jgi:hypothetical protein
MRLLNQDALDSLLKICMTIGKQWQMAEETPIPKMVPL